MNEHRKLLGDQGVVLRVAGCEVSHLTEDRVDPGSSHDGLGGSPDHRGGVESHVAGEHLVLVGGVHIL